jgi:hypothetical protein
MHGVPLIHSTRFRGKEWIYFLNISRLANSSGSTCRNLIFIGIYSDLALWQLSIILPNPIEILQLPILSDIHYLKFLVRVYVFRGTVLGN